MRFEEAYECWTEKRPGCWGYAPLGRFGDHRNRHQGWHVKHDYVWYKREGGARSDTWVKNTLQQAGVVNKVPKRGVHREMDPWPGMMLHQDGSQHQWVAGQYWDLIVTMVAP